MVFVRGVQLLRAAVINSSNYGRRTTNVLLLFRIIFIPLGEVVALQGLSG